MVRGWLPASVGSLGPSPVDDQGGGCPLVAWAASGAMRLTGEPDGPPVLAPGAMFSVLHEVGELFAEVSGRVGVSVRVDPGLVLSGRAGLMALSRRGRISAGGATRLLRAADGWCAVSLARPGDFDLVPAMVGRANVGDPWKELIAAAERDEARGFAGHVQQFGVPAAALPVAVPVVGVPWNVTTIAESAANLRLDDMLVVDLSSLWAGPLCAHLLGRAGATVVKVESVRRPDGARRGNQGFFDWLHAGQQSVAVDFTTVAGRTALADLVRAADIVIEASRPRALAQLGLAPEDFPHRQGKVWVSITGYGRREPERVAFGDDAAVAGGLVGWSDGQPVFCADAIADPLTGLVAAVASMIAVAGGGGQLIDVAMRDVAAVFAASPAVDHGPHPVRRDGAGWVVGCPVEGEHEVAPPRLPDVDGVAAAMGADTERVLSSLGR